VFPSLAGGTFGTRLDFAAGGGPLVVADFDMDSRLDVATANNWPTNSVSVLFGQPGGGLGERVDHGAGDQPWGIVAADVTGDGLPDLLTANMNSNSVSVLPNTGGVAWLPWLGAPPRPAAATSFSAFPSPARDQLHFEFALPHAGHVRLRLYDVAGRVLATLADGAYAPGTHRVAWARARGEGAAGVCFAELVTADERRVRRVVLLP
jgi:hypothetical protein